MNNRCINRYKNRNTEISAVCHPVILLATANFNNSVSLTNFNKFFSISHHTFTEHANLSIYVLVIPILQVKFHTEDKEHRNVPHVQP